MSAYQELGEARTSLQQAAYDLAVNQLEAEYPTCSDDPHLSDVIATAVASLVNVGEADRNKIAMYAAARGRSFLSEQAAGNLLTFRSNVGQQVER